MARVRLPGLLMRGPGYPEEFSNVWFDFLYVQKKVFVILGLELPAGRLRPAAAVTPAPEEAPEARVPAGRGSSRLASVVTTTRCETEPFPARYARIVCGLGVLSRGGSRHPYTAAGRGPARGAPGGSRH